MKQCTFRLCLECVDSNTIFCLSVTTLGTYLKVCLFILGLTAAAEIRLAGSLMFRLLDLHDDEESSEATLNSKAN